MTTAGPLGSIAQERERRIQARINQGAGALEEFRGFLDDALAGERRAVLSAALDFATAMEYRHAGLSSASYLAHPLRVTRLTQGLVPEAPVETLVIALLHNVFEVTAVTPEELEHRFGAVVRQALEDLTVDRQRQWQPAYKAAYYRRLREGYRGACIVKVIDKLDNVFVLGLNPDAEVRQRYLEEMQTDILPLAQRDVPAASQYIARLIDDCRQHGYLEQEAARVAAIEEKAALGEKAS